MSSRQALGKGLAALIPPSDTSAAREGLHWLPIEALSPNPRQPRRHFAEEAIAALAESIKQQGLMQPILVRRQGGDGYQIVAGERRWRAAGRAGLQQVPVRIKELSDRQSLELALVENVQREDLNPIEEAQAYASLVSDFGHTQAKVAELVGRERATVANLLRLLKLPQRIQEDVQNGRLSMGHARALLSLENSALQLKAHREILKKGLTVRQVERLAKASGRRTPPQRRPWAHLERELERDFGVKTRIQSGRKGVGRVVFSFSSEAELTRLIDAFRISARG